MSLDNRVSGPDFQSSTDFPCLLTFPNLNPITSKFPPLMADRFSLPMTFLVGMCYLSGASTREDECDIPSIARRS